MPSELGPLPMITQLQSPHVGAKSEMLGTRIAASPVMRSPNPRLRKVRSVKSPDRRSRKHNRSASTMLSVVQKASKFFATYAFRGIYDISGTEPQYVVCNRKTGKNISTKAMIKSKESAKRMQQEYKILKSLRHAHIIRVKVQLEGPHHYYLVTQMVQGPRLLENVVTDDLVGFEDVTEAYVCGVMKTILQTVQYCHESSAIHRALCLENFRYKTYEPDAPLLLTNFRHAVDFTTDEDIILDDKRLFADENLLPYIAPELLKEKMLKTGDHWKKGDVWSIGVIAFVLLTGYFPVQTPGDVDPMETAKTGKVIWRTRGLSKDAVDFLRRILDPDPDKRLTVRQCLRHPWLRTDWVSPPKLLRGQTNFSEVPSDDELDEKSEDDRRSLPGVRALLVDLNAYLSLRRAVRQNVERAALVSEELLDAVLEGGGMMPGGGVTKEEMLVLMETCCGYYRPQALLLLESVFPEAPQVYSIDATKEFLSAIVQSEKGSALHAIASFYDPEGSKWPHSAIKSSLSGFKRYPKKLDQVQSFDDLCEILPVDEGKWDFFPPLL